MIPRWMGCSKARSRPLSGPFTAQVARLRTMVSLVLLVSTTSAGAWGDGAELRTARKRFYEGVAAVDAGNYELARVSFQQAYALKAAPSVLRNLGEAEFRTDHFVEAARHLSTYLLDTNAGSAADRSSAAQTLQQVEQAVGKLLIEVDVDGTEVQVDGVPTGLSHGTPETWYLEPGEAHVRVSKPGFVQEYRSIVVQAGRATRVTFSLRRSESKESLAAVLEHSAGATESGVAASPPPSETMSSGRSPQTPLGVGPTPAHAPVEDANTSAPNDQARTWVVLSTAAGSLLAMGAFTIFTVQRSNETSHIARARDELTNSDTGACAGPSPLSSACSDLAHATTAHNVARDRQTVSLATAIVLGGASAATLFLIPTHSNSARERTGGGAALHVSLLPLLAGSGMVHLSGAF